MIDAALVEEMEADPQDEPNLGPYALGTMVMPLDDGTLMVGHAGGGTDWPYTSVMQVFTGETPIAIAVLIPQPADFAEEVFGGFMQLHDVATS